MSDHITPQHRYYTTVVELERRIPGLNVTTIGGACPFQAEGDTPDGQEFYFRYRHDEATLYVFTAGGDHWSHCTLYAEAANAMDADYDRGVLDADEATDLFMRLWTQLRPRSEFTATGSERLALNVAIMRRVMQDGDADPQRVWTEAWQEVFGVDSTPPVLKSES